MRQMRNNARFASEDARSSDFAMALLLPLDLRKNLCNNLIRAAFFSTLCLKTLRA